MFLATIDPFLGVRWEHRSEATRASLVDDNGNLLGGVPVRAYSIFVWTKEPMIDGRMRAFQKFLAKIVRNSSRTEFPVVRDADLFEGAKLVEWQGWRDTNSVRAKYQYDFSGVEQTHGGLDLRVPLARSQLPRPDALVPFANFTGGGRDPLWRPGFDRALLRECCGRVCDGIRCWQPPVSRARYISVAHPR